MFLAVFPVQRHFTDESKMTETQRLLAEYVGNGSQTAFRELVTRYINLVYSTAQRSVGGDSHFAEDVAQTVFVHLARKAHTLTNEATLGGWLHRDTCHVAATLMRGERRRQNREKQAVEMNSLQDHSEANLAQVSPILDEAINRLGEEDRTAILLRFFEQRDLRSVGEALGSSENAAQKRVSRALEELRVLLKHRGVSFSAAALGTALACEAVTAAPTGLAFTISGTALATAATATVSSASALASTSAGGASFFLALMKTTTTTKIIGAAAALLFTAGTIHHFTQKDLHQSQPIVGEPGAAPVATSDSSQSTATGARKSVDPLAKPARSSPASRANSAPPLYDEAALNAAREKEQKFLRRMQQLALMSDPLKVQGLLLREYGIHFSVDEIRSLQEKGPKFFTQAGVELWATKQPQQALAWAASAVSKPIQHGWDLHQSLLDAAQKILPNLDRNTLAAMLPDGPGKAKMLDLVEAATDRPSMANRILALADPAERASGLKLLAQAWSDADAEPAAEWARQNLSGTDKMAFYEQVGYNLAHQNPQAALQVLAELKGTEGYTSTFGAMMRGLVQEGGQGQPVAELIANSDLNARERAELMSQLARRWVRNDPDRAMAWINTLNDPQDFLAATPQAIAQLDNDRLSRTVEACLKNPDPTMEMALIGAANNMNDLEKSRVILDSLIRKDPEFKLKFAESSDLESKLSGYPSIEAAFQSNRETFLMMSVNEIAQDRIKDGQAAAAMEWLSTLPFASQSDCTKTIADALSAWKRNSQTEADGWLQNSALDPTLKSELLKAVRP
jgi:RNA polymerase sigma factor (sigma-70 family)